MRQLQPSLLAMQYAQVSMTRTQTICLLLRHVHGVDKRALLIEEYSGTDKMRKYRYGDVLIWACE